MTVTGIIAATCMYPLRAIIDLCVALRIHPNTLTLVGVIINMGAAWALGYQRFILAGFVMVVANIFDFIDGKVALELELQSQFGAFWDSTLDRFSDLALLTGLIFLYSNLERTDYVMVAALALIFSIMTSYARAPRRILGREVQGRLHGTPRTHRALHDRGFHQPDGGRPVGHSRAVDPRRREQDLLHLPRAQ